MPFESILARRDATSRVECAPYEEGSTRPEPEKAFRALDQACSLGEQFLFGRATSEGISSYNSAPVRIEYLDDNGAVARAASDVSIGRRWQRDPNAPGSICIETPTGADFVFLYRDEVRDVEAHRAAIRGARLMVAKWLWEQRLVRYEYRENLWVPGFVVSEEERFWIPLPHSYGPARRGLPLVGRLAVYSARDLVILQDIQEEATT